MFRSAWLVPISIVSLLASQALLPVGRADAANLTVTTTADEFGENLMACSLREAIQAANTNTAFGGCPAGDALAPDTITI